MFFTPSTCSSARSFSQSEPTILAGCSPESANVTVTDEAPLITPVTRCALVMTSPELPITTPVPWAMTRPPPLGARKGLDCVVVACTETTPWRPLPLPAPARRRPVQRMPAHGRLAPCAN